MQPDSNFERLLYNLKTAIKLFFLVLKEGRENIIQPPTFVTFREKVTRVMNH